MSDETVAAPSTEEATAPSSAAPSNEDVMRELAQLRELVGEHATALGAMHEELAKDHGERLLMVEERTAQLHTRINEVLDRVDGKPAAPKKPAEQPLKLKPEPGEVVDPIRGAPRPDLVFDGTQWVPRARP